MFTSAHVLKQAHAGILPFMSVLRERPLARKSGSITLFSGLTSPVNEASLKIARVHRRASKSLSEAPFRGPKSPESSTRFRAHSCQRERERSGDAKLQGQADKGSGVSMCLWPWQGIVSSSMCSCDVLCVCQRHVRHDVSMVIYTPLSTLFRKKIICQVKISRQAANQLPRRRIREKLKGNN